MSLSVDLLKRKGYLLLALLAIVVFIFLSLSAKFYLQPSEFQPFTINNALVTRGRTWGTRVPPSNSTRLLCWILTYPKGIQKAEAAVNTWLPRCDQHLLFSSKEDKKHAAIGLDVIEGWSHLTGKTMKAQEYLYTHHLNDADWFFKGDDDTYVIVENLRYLLSFFNANDAVYLGLHFNNPLFNHTYMSGGAGYVISRAALKRMLEEGWKKPDCVKDGTYEDADIGKCLQSVGVAKGATEDVFGRETFHPLSPQIHIEGNYPGWVYKIMANKVKKGYEAVSNYTISFHKVSNVEIYMLDFLIYHLKRYGAQEKLPKENMFEGRLLKN